MKILFFGNNRLGYNVLRWLREQNEEIVGLVLHPEGKAKFSAEMRAVVAGEGIPILDGARLGKPEVMETIRALNAEMGVSILFGYILRQPLLDLFERGCINLHPSFLPFNRGEYPNVWSIVEGTPAGVTLHRIDAGIDTGAILAQARVPVEPFDTGALLYARLEERALTLFQDNWGDFCEGRLEGKEQDLNEGTTHRVRDVRTIDEIDLDQMYTAQELINILRARTFPPYDGAFFWSQGRKVFMRLELYEGEAVEKS